jgi:hypothetical protein
LGFSGNSELYCNKTNKKLNSLDDPKFGAKLLPSTLPPIPKKKKKKKKKEKFYLNPSNYANMQIEGQS